MQNRKRRHTTLWVILFSLSGLLAVTNLYASESKLDAPNFTLKSYSGKNIKLSEYRGQMVLINFWASWCGPCRQEMPELEKLYKKYNKLGFTIFGVNVEEDSNEAIKVIEQSNLSFPILFDSENMVSQLYEVSAMPTTVMVDRDGKIRFLHRAYKPGDEKIYKKWIKQLIRE